LFQLAGSIKQAKIKEFAGRLVKSNRTAARFYSPGIRQADVESSLKRMTGKIKICDAAGKE
jgi:hypothetical protein